MSLRAVRNGLRARFPRVFALYKRRMRRHVMRGDAHYAIARWVNDGLALRSRIGLADVSFDHDGVWFTDARGLHWSFDPGIWGSTLGAATGSSHESAELDAVCRYLDNSSVVVDVGANIGAFALPVAKTTGARIIAVEPVSSTFALLNRNVQRNQASGSISTIRSAVGATIGEVVLTTDAQSANYVLAGQGVARINEERVPVTTLDELLRTELRIDLIKVDVEGLELDVMRGAAGTLRKHAPAVLLEIEARWTSRYGYAPVTLFTYMAEAGYGYKTITDAGPVPSTDLAADINRGNNFLFTHHARTEG